MSFWLFRWPRDGGGAADPDVAAGVPTLGAGVPHGPTVGAGLAPVSSSPPDSSAAGRGATCQQGVA